MSIDETFMCGSDLKQKINVLNFLVEVSSIICHLTQNNNISVLFVVDRFKSANNMFVDEI